MPTPRHARQYTLIQTSPNHNSQNDAPISWTPGVSGQKLDPWHGVNDACRPTSRLRRTFNGYLTYYEFQSIAKMQRFIQSKAVVDRTNE